MGDSWKCFFRLSLLVTVLICIIFYPLWTTSRAQEHLEVIKIGVLAKRGKKICLEKWGPTADYLTKEIPGYSFTILPLGYDEVNSAVKDETVDFIFANSSFYVELELLYNVNRIATLKNLRLGGVYTIYGGVIFCRVDRNDISNIQDLKGKTFMSLDEKAFASWPAVWREMKEVGIDPYTDFADLQFRGPMDEVVFAVRDGRVDAGSVRTDLLERMEMEGQIRIEDFRILMKHDTPQWEIPFVHSTRMYPEWPMAKVYHTSDELAEKVAVALIGMATEETAAKAALCAGWTVPLNYQSVHDCMKELQIGPYMEYGKVSLLAVIQQYWYWIVSITILSGVLLTAYLIKINKKLQMAVIEQEKELTERKKAEEELRESEAQFRNLFEQAAVGMAHVALNGQFLRINKRFCEITGYSEQEILERTYQDITYPDDLYAQNEARKRVSDGETSSYRIEKRYIRKDGNIIWGNLTAGVLIRKLGSEPNYFVSVLEDITEKKKMEETLLQSEKLRAMGMITAGVAHDFNNILAVISGNAQLMEGNYGDHKEMMDDLHIISRAVSDGAEIVRKMKKFAIVGRTTSEFISVDIKNILEQAIEFSRPRWMNIAKAKGITYDIDKKGLKRVPAVLGSPSELREVLVNIINNALDAMSEGGCITFRTWSKDDAVFVSISDTGEGMTEEVRKKVFDPFFTTKRAEGSGLGTSIAYGVIIGHGGKIEVESEVGKGTTFIMSIPITRETPQEAVVSPEPPRKIKAHGLRILVIDDDEQICSMLNKYFSRDGHDVKSVNSGTEAIRLLKNEDFDLVLCDLIMPGMTGHDIVKVIGELDKRPKVGLITGWDEKLETKSREELNVDFIVRKPFDFSKLANHVNEILGA